MNVKLFKQNITKRDEEEQYTFIKEIICQDNVSISNIYFLNTWVPSFVKETALQVISHVDTDSGRCHYPVSRVDRPTLQNLSREILKSPHVKKPNVPK